MKPFAIATISSVLLVTSAHAQFYGPGSVYGGYPAYVVPAPPPVVIQQAPPVVVQTPPQIVYRDRVVVKRRVVYKTREVPVPVPAPSNTTVNVNVCGQSATTSSSTSAPVCKPQKQSIASVLRPSTYRFSIVYIHCLHSHCIL